MTSGLSCKLLPTKKPPLSLTKPIELSYWGVWDSSDDWQPLIDDFNIMHPNIKIIYKKFRYAEYEQKLLEAWAEDRGPDIYSIPATWLKKYQERITPMPASVKLSFREVKKVLGKTEISDVVRQLPTFSLNDIKNKFVDVINDDIIMDGQIYGLPFSVDTLVLYYNRDILDSNGIAVPPGNWTELAETVKKITKVDKNNNIIQSAIALGTANNVPQAFDIVSLLMMQNGTQMISSTGQVNFHLSPTKERDNLPGLQALLFYTDFANPIKEVYSWNAEQLNAFEAFISGKLAMLYGYSYYLPLIKTQAPKLDVGIAPMTQIQGATNPLNYTDYWVETVSHKTKSIDASWGFLTFAASQNETEKYLEKTKKPAALRNLITKQREDPEISVFANQTLSATHWYKGKDILKAEEIFKELIETLPNSAEPTKLLELTAKKINLTL